MCIYITGSAMPTFSISSNPLFSTLLSFSALILLNFPRLLWRILLSPPVLLTGFLFLSLLRLGATQISTQRQIKNRKNRSQFAALSKALTEASELVAVSVGATQRSILSQAVEIDSKQSEISAAVSQAITEASEVAVSCAFLNKTQRSIQLESSAAVSEAVSDGSDGGASSARSFVQWNVRAPLEVIHEEEYEREASNESDEPEPRVERVKLERYPSLSMYYPETDSDSSSEGVWPESSMDDNVCYVWDEDEDRDEMIEISLDQMNYKKVSGFELELEDNLIEIDISPTRNAGEFSDEC